MSNQEDKIKSSLRRHRDETAVNKQIKIAQAHKIPITEPHKYVKHHVTNCGNPRCVICSNPRHVFNEATIQERRFDQDKLHIDDEETK
jgi:hypothetical protein